MEDVAIALASDPVFFGVEAQIALMTHCCRPLFLLDGRRKVIVKVLLSRLKIMLPSICHRNSDIICLFKKFFDLSKFNFGLIPLLLLLCVNL